MEAIFSDYKYMSIDRVAGGGYTVAGQSDHMPADGKAKIGDYTFYSKSWKGIRTYITAYANGRKVFDGCYIDLHEWSSGDGRMCAYSINFDKVLGGFVERELAEAMVSFLKEIWQ